MIDTPSPALADPRRLRLLAVSDNPTVIRDVTHCAVAEGADLEHAPAASAALKALGAGRWNVACAVLEQDAEEQLGWWTDVLGRLPKPPRLVALVPEPPIQLSLRAVSLGVFDVQQVPLNRDRFRELLRRVWAAEYDTTVPLPMVQPVRFGTSELVARSPALLPMFRAIAQVAKSTATVLITGDSGTGKELVAQAVHSYGPRVGAPFVPVNCAAIPEHLLESELFGHEKGAFTGAVARKIGRFERANGGTLFLDEVGDMSLALQSKILRAVQEREIERVGGTEAIAVDVRLIAATNRDLRAMIAEGRFREDLYYRLAVVNIKLPPLAERGDDLLDLTSFFLQEFGKRYGKTFTSISTHALEALRRHEWVGNVRELRNVMERAVVVADSDGVLRMEHLPDEWRNGCGPDYQPDTGGLVTLQELETRQISRVLHYTHGHISEAARILGVHRNTLTRKMRMYGL